MEDIDIITKFTTLTKNGQLVWEKNKASFGLRRSYLAKFVGTDYVVIEPYNYLDMDSIVSKDTYKLGFYDADGDCYKVIQPAEKTSAYFALKNLYETLEEKNADLDNKLNRFFKIHS